MQLGLTNHHAELDGDDGDYNEQHEVDGLVGIVDAEVKKRRIEKERRGSDSRDSCNHSRNDAPAQCGDQHRDQIKDRDVLDLEEKQHNAKKMVTAVTISSDNAMPTIWSASQRPRGPLQNSWMWISTTRDLLSCVLSA